MSSASLRLATTLSAAALWGAAATAQVPGAEDVRESEGRVSLTLASDAVAAALPRLGALGVEGLRIAPPSLEELFLRHYGDAPTAGPDGGDG